MAATIWAPWRIEYLREPHASAGCVLCEHAGDAPSAESGVLLRSAFAFVMLNRYPYGSAHVMVVPRRHVGTLEGLDDPEYTALFQLVRATVRVLTQAVHADGMNVGINLGRAAGAGIDAHLHVHAVPRWAGDQNFMPVIADTRVMPEYLAETWRHLRPAFEVLEAAP
jgi:ATP adenylyltransferase